MTKKEIISEIMNLVNLFGKRSPINPISKYFEIYKGSFYSVFVDVDTNDLHNITVTFKNDVGEKATYTLKLRAE